MEYYEQLGLARDPFADTANPYFLYASEAHQDCLRRLATAVRLGRGLSLVLGDVGTGKTSMALALEHFLRCDARFLPAAIYDPTFHSEADFLTHLMLAHGVPCPAQASVLQKMETLKKFLYHRGIDDGRAVVLILDEGQNLAAPLLELVRLLLNFQVPQQRLFNVVIFAHLDLLHAVAHNPPLQDRINLLHLLHPLDREQTGALIAFRLQQAGRAEGPELFSRGAQDRIYRASGGQPRSIVRLCQQALEEAADRSAPGVDEALVDTILARRDADAQLVARFLARRSPPAVPAPGLAGDGGPAPTAPEGPEGDRAASGPRGAPEAALRAPAPIGTPAPPLPPESGGPPGPPRGFWQWLLGQ